MAGHLRNKTSRAQFSKKVLERDEYCRICSARFFFVRATEAHHIIGKGPGGKDDLLNGLGLCWKCHREITDGREKVPASVLTEEQKQYIQEKKYPGYKKIEWSN